MKKILLTEYFKNKYEARDKEVLESIQNNLSSKVFDEILIMCENDIPDFIDNGNIQREYKRFLLKQKINVKSNQRSGRIKNMKSFVYKKNSIKCVLTNKRQTFKSMFEYANKHYPDSIVVVANNDIYFDESIKL